MMKRHPPMVIGLLALIALGGCATITDSCYEQSQTVRALKEYWKTGNPDCSPHPHDYKCGWIDGFYEVATGGDLCPPAIAPARYYKPKQILKHCDQKRNAYYSGWQDGAARASQFPDTHYLRIYETCECPFPRCDKPCGDAACGPCGMTFVGIGESDALNGADGMIEVLPMAPPPVVEVPEGPSTSNFELGDDQAIVQPLRLSPNGPTMIETPVERSEPSQDDSRPQGGPEELPPNLLSPQLDESTSHGAPADVPFIANQRVSAGTFQYPLP